MKENGERLAIVETDMRNLNTKVNSIENLLQSLHGKIDMFTQLLTENYVAKATFEEYKKNRLLERVLTVLVTGVIMGLIGFFLRERGA